MLVVALRTRCRAPRSPNAQVPVVQAKLNALFVFHPDVRDHGAYFRLGGGGLKLMGAGGVNLK